MTLAMSAEQIRSGRQLRDELPFFARNALHIRDKEGAILPLRLNAAQIALHAKLEAQREVSGMVRAVVVKGRQLGSSTYVQGRFYHRLWGSDAALRAYILTHEDAATENLFGMARRFQETIPEAIRPRERTANAKELIFAHNGAGYRVATAGNKAGGRSDTIQLFHGSEVAYWPNAEDHMAGVMQAVPKSEGTEIILESTANGIGNVFHRQAMAAVRGLSDFQIIFIPWFWDEAYASPCPDDFEPSRDWLDYAQAHDLTWEQLYWAHSKNAELAISISAEPERPCWKFMQEYPATFEEAFQTSGNSFISGAMVLKARRPAETVIGTGPIILGVDPARSGDRVGIIDRCGRRLGQRICERMDPGGSVTYVAGKIAEIIHRIQPDMVNIDVGSNGAGVYDILHDLGYGSILNAVNFGSNPLGKGPTGDDLYFNRRAEMYDQLRLWLSDERPVQVPDDDGLHADLTAAVWGAGATRYNTSNELILEEKDAIKKRLGASPDLGDAAALTFAVPFAIGAQAAHQPRTERRTRNKRGGY